MKKREVLWKDRKRNFLGWPWSFTVYQLDDSRLFIQRGFLSQQQDEVRLYRITDVSLRRSLWQRMIGTGTIHCDSADQTMQNFEILNIKKPADTMEMLSELVEKSRRENRVYTRENMMTGPHGGPNDSDFEPDAYDHEPMGHGYEPDDDEEN